jgi:SprT protein
MDSLPVPVQSIITGYLSGIQFKTVNPRKNALGTWSYMKDYHEIVLNNDLTGIQFMLTLVHEIAHARTWDLFKGSVKPHGREWKDQYRKLMLPLLQGYFDKFTDNTLTEYMKNPMARTNSSLHIRRLTSEGQLLVEDVPLGYFFSLKSGLVVKKIKKLRTRWLVEGENGSYYYAPASCLAFL